jgi:hypothetical protein
MSHERRVVHNRGRKSLRPPKQTENQKKKKTKSNSHEALQTALKMFVLKVKERSGTSWCLRAIFAPNDLSP